MKIIDLRSDTVTKPTPKMREAMAAAEVGDDVQVEISPLFALDAEQLAEKLPTGTRIMGPTYFQP